MPRHPIRNLVHRSRSRGGRLAPAIAALLCSLAWALSHAQTALPMHLIKLPPGFAIEVVARIPNARAMTWGAGGTLFVGSASEGKVYALTLPPPQICGTNSAPETPDIGLGDQS